MEAAAMARYKHIDTSPRFLAVDLERQLIPGSFEHALNHLLDHEMDLSGLDKKGQTRFRTLQSFMGYRYRSSRVCQSRST
jgi:hypothetical protein